MPATTAKWALVTGCSHAGGLGVHFCLALLKHDYNVIATARDESSLAALREAGCHTLSLDVTSVESINKAVQSTMTLTGGKLNCLVNNAGAFGRGLVLDQDLNNIRAVFEVNVFGVIAMCQAFTPLLIEGSSATSEKRSRSRILNIGSTAQATPAHCSSYGTSKAAIRSYSDALRWELQGLGIDVLHAVIGAFQYTDFALGSQATMPAISQTGTQSALNPALPDVYAHCRDNVWKHEITYTAGFYAESDMSVDEIADRTIRWMLKGRKPIFYLGKGSSLVRWIVPILPIKMLDKVMVKSLGISPKPPNKALQ